MGKLKSTNQEIIDFFFFLICSWLICSHPLLCLNTLANIKCEAGSKEWLQSFSQSLIAAESSQSTISDVEGLLAQVFTTRDGCVVPGEAVAFSAVNSEPWGACSFSQMTASDRLLTICYSVDAFNCMAHQEKKIHCSDSAVPGLFVLTILASWDSF